MLLCIFPKDTKDMMASKCLSAALMGFGISRMQLAAKAAQVACCLQIQKPFCNDEPGKDWLAAFRHRHPDLWQYIVRPWR